MKTSKRLLVAVLSLAAMGATSAMAADLGGSYKDTPSARDYMPEYGRGWMLRARVLGVIPDEGGDIANLDITNSVVPELDLSYFFSKNIAIEVIAGVTPHDIKVDGTKIAETTLLPPTVTLQYHFDTGSAFKPYVGAGVNYTAFLDEQDIDLKNAWGLAVQAGFDYHLQGNWFLNVDVKKIWLDTEIKGTDTSVEIDPLIVGVGIGYRFGGVEALK